MKKVIFSILTLALLSFSLHVKAQATQESGAYTCTKDQQEPSRKVCSDKSAQTYLKENFYQTVKATHELAEAECNWALPITAGAALNTNKFGVTCESKNLVNKLVAGWAAADKKYMEVMKGLGDSQLLWRGKMETGNLSCVESQEYKKVPNGVFGMRCVMTVASGDKLFSSIIFTQPSNVKHRRFFIGVLNVSQVSTPQDVEDFLVKVTSQ